MTKAAPFEFHEVLPTETLNNLPESLHIKEKSNPEILLILRLLSGALMLEHCYSEQKIDQMINYFVADLKPFRENWGIKFPEIIGENITANDLSSYISSVKYKNRSFYKNILFEISNFFLHTNRGSHTAAFIFVYRVLENIAYAFPLIYVSRTDDFTRTFDYLKELFVENNENKEGGKNKGELGFYKSFVLSLYKDDPIAESTVDFNIAVMDIQVQRTIFNALSEVTQKIQGGATESPRKISIQFCEMGSFIITVRNRFFHNMNGGVKNFDSQSIVDSDIFFSLLNNTCLSWIATIFLGILSHHLEQFDGEK